MGLCCYYGRARVLRRINWRIAHHGTSSSWIFERTVAPPPERAHSSIILPFYSLNIWWALWSVLLFVPIVTLDATFAWTLNSLAAIFVSSIWEALDQYFFFCGAVSYERFFQYLAAEVYSVSGYLQSSTSGKESTCNASAIGSVPTLTQVFLFLGGMGLDLTASQKLS